MKNKITFTGANIVFFSFIAVYFVFQVLLVIPAVIYGENFFSDNIYKILLINQYVIVLLPVAAYVLVKRLDIRDVFRFNRLRLLPAVIILFTSVPAFFTAAMLNTIVLYVLQFLGKIPGQSIPQPANLRELIIGMLVIAVSPAICEELLHRGVMLRAYENRGSMKAILFTSFLFGIFHFDITNFLGPVFLGVIIAFYVIRTNSIFAGMLAHFLNNAFSELLQYLVKDVPSGDEYIHVSGTELFGSILYGAAGFILVCLLLKLFKLATQRTSIEKPSISTLKHDLISVFSHWPVIVACAVYIISVGIYVFAIIATGLGLS